MTAPSGDDRAAEDAQTILLFVDALRDGSAVALLIWRQEARHLRIPDLTDAIKSALRARFSHLP